MKIGAVLKRVGATFAYQRISCAGVAIRMRDAPFQIEREEDDLGRVGVALRPITFLPRGRLGLPPLDHFVFELVDASNLPRQRREQILVVCGVGPALVAGETDPAVDV